MKNEEIRIAIAEACGWTFHGSDESRKAEAIMCWTYAGREFQPMNMICLPDFLNDLNAIHEAEKVLTDEQCFTYFDYIAKTNGEGLHKQIFATAPQRCEAFLRCIGKWTDHPACNGTGEKEGRA